MSNIGQSQSISQFWGAQSDIPTDDAFTSVIFDEIHDCAYIIGYIDDLDDDADTEELLGLYLPNANTNISDFGEKDVVIIKITLQSEIIWALSLGGPKDDVPTGACVDQMGNLYLVGSSKSNIQFPSLDNSNSFSFADDGGGSTTGQAFICSYNTDGQLRWAKQEGGQGDDAFHSITNTSSGVVAIGHFTENNFEQLQGINVTSINDDTDTFIAKYSHTGGNLWLMAGGSQENDFDTDNDLEDARWDITSYNDTIYFASLFNGIDFNFDYSTNAASINTLISIYSTSVDPDYAIGGITPNGQLMWMKSQLIENGDTRTVSITADCSGIYIGGVAQDWLYWLGPDPGFKYTSGNDDMFIAKYHPTTGAPLAYRLLSSPNNDNDILYDMANDGLGNIYMTGTFRNSINTGTSNTPAYNSGAAFLLSFNSSLIYQSSAFINDAGSLEIGYSICTTPQGDLLMVGKSNGNLVNGQSVDNSSYDGFFLSYNVNQIASNPCCSNSAFTCPSSPITLFKDANCSAFLPNYAEAWNNSINCPLSYVTQTPPSGTNLGLGFHSIGFYQNNILQCTLLVEVRDTIAPSISCPNIAFSLSTNTVCNAIVPDYTSLALYDDNCTLNSNINVFQLPTAGTILSGVNTFTVLLKARDQSGNEGYCSFEVQTVDNIAPSLTCPATQKLNLGALCNAALPDYRSQAIKSDNCTPAANITLTQSPAPGTMVSGAGTTFVTLTAMDAAGLTTTCTFNVNRVDNTPPSLTCPATQTLSLGALCNAALPDYRSQAIKSDNCTPATNITLTQLPAPGTIVSGAGTTFVTLTAMDAAGLTTTCTFNVNRADNIAPSLTCPATQTLNLDALCNATLPDYRSQAIKSDNCTPAANITLTQSPAPGTIVSGAGTTFVTLIAMDATGLTTTCTFNVNRVDNTPPSLTCPTTQTLNLGALCNAALPDYRSQAIKSDNCTPAANITLTQSPTPGTMVSGAGTTFVTLTAMDAAGLFISCEFMVEVNDTIAPIIACPLDLELVLDDHCQVLVPDYRDQVQVTDPCTSSIDILINQFPAPGTLLNSLDQFLLTFTAMDANGNQTSCETIVSMIDTLPPTIDCPTAPINIFLDDQCLAEIPNLQSFITADDNCSIMNTLFFEQIPAAGSLVYDTTSVPVITYYIDGSGNETMCAVTINVEPFGVMTPICPQNQIIWLDVNCESALADYSLLADILQPCLSDNNYTWTQVPESGTLLQGEGDEAIELILQSELYGTSSCSFTVQAVVSIEQQIICPSNDTINSGLNCEGILPNYTAVSIPQNTCASLSDWTFVQTPSAGAPITSESSVQIEVTYLDQSVSCSFTVTLNDQSSPVIECPNTAIVAPQSTCEIWMPNLSEILIANDNCDTPNALQWSQIPLAGTLLTNETMAILHVTDMSDNSSVCEVMIAMPALATPTLACPESINLPVQTDCSYIVGDALALASIEPNCSAEVTWNQTPGIGSSYNGEFSSIAVTASIAGGPTLTCEIAISLDEIDIVLDCPDEVMQTYIPTCENVIGDFASNVGIQYNCQNPSDYSWIQEPSLGAPVNLEEETMTFTITSLDGSSASCTTPIVYVEIEEFTMECPSQINVTAASNCMFTTPEITAVLYDACGNPIEYLSQISPLVNSIHYTNEFNFIELVSLENEGYVCHVPIVFEIPTPDFDCPSDTLIYMDASHYIVEDFRPFSIFTDCLNTEWTVEQQPTSGDLITASQALTIVYSNPEGESFSCVSELNLHWIENTLYVNCPDTFAVPLGDNCTMEDIDIAALIATIPITSTSAYSWDYVESGVSYTNTQTMIITATNMGGASASCEISFVPEDLLPPALFTFINTLEIATDLNCQYIVPDLSDQINVYENCSYQIYQNPLAGSILNEAISVEITAIDASGLSSNAFIELIPLIDQPSELPQLADIILYADPMTCVSEYNWLELIIPFDNCHPYSIHTTAPYNNSYEMGEYELGYFGMDEMGNATDTNYFHISVLDAVAPFIQAYPGDQIYLCDPSEQWEIPLISDCHAFSYELIQNDLVYGTNQVTIEAVDIYNNVSVYTFDIIVSEATWPEILDTTSFCANAELVLLPIEPFDNIIWFADGEAVSYIDPSLYASGAHSLNGQAVLNGCAVDTLLEFTILSIPTHSGLSDNYHICGNKIEINWQTDATSVVWEIDESILIVQENNTLNIEILEYGTHEIQFELNNEFCQTSTNTVVVNDEPIALIDAGQDQMIAYGLNGSLNGTASTTNIEWTALSIGATITNPNELETPIGVALSGIYEFVLHAENGKCEANDTTLVHFQAAQLPNTITPNGDKINDTFVIPGDQTDQITLKIVNRWGQLMFEDQNYLNTWGGQDQSGEALPADTYFYEFTIIGTTQTGFIQIQR